MLAVIGAILFAIAAFVCFAGSAGVSSATVLGLLAAGACLVALHLAWPWAPWHRANLETAAHSRDDDHDPEDNGERSDRDNHRCMPVRARLPVMTVAMRQGAAHSGIAVVDLLVGRFGRVLPQHGHLFPANTRQRHPQQLHSPKSPMSQPQSQSSAPLLRLNSPIS